MATSLNLGKDNNSNVTYSLPVSDTGASGFMNLNTEYTLTVPENVNVAFFSFSRGTNVFVQLNGAALGLPGPGLLDGTTVELNPGVRNVEPGDTLRFISDTNAYVTVKYYKRAPGRS